MNRVLEIDALVVNKYIIGIEAWYNLYAPEDGHIDALNSMEKQLKSIKDYGVESVKGRLCTYHSMQM